MSITINEVMTRTPHTIGHDIPVSKAKLMMREYNCHHLPVLDGGRLVGVISDRDLKLVERLPHGDETLIEDLMTDEPFVVSPDLSVKDVLTKMLDNKINSVIVSAKGDQSWGIFTSTDALAYFVDKVN